MYHDADYWINRAEEESKIFYANESNQLPKSPNVPAWFNELLMSLVLVSFRAGYTRGVRQYVEESLIP